MKRGEKEDLYDGYVFSIFVDPYSEYGSGSTAKNRTTNLDFNEPF